LSEVVVHDDLHSITTSCDPRPKKPVVPVVSAIEVVKQENFLCLTSTGDLPRELFTVEQVLLFLARAVKSLEQSGLKKG
jgi:hypothetical protein